MPFSVKDWKDYPDTSTPITQAALEDMETRLSTYTTQRTVISVAEYGAKGDGTTNDASAIQAALNAANTAGGGTVFIPRGTYILNSELLVYSNTAVVGEGPASILKRTGTGPAKCLASSAYASDTFGANVNIEVRNLTVDRTETTSTDPFDNGIYMHRVDGVLVQGVRAVGGAKGIHLLGCEAGRVIGCHTRSFSDNGIAVNWSGSATPAHNRGVVVTGNTIIGGPHPTYLAVEPTPFSSPLICTQKGTIISNNFINVPASPGIGGGHGIEIGDEGEMVIANNRLSGCSILIGGGSGHLVEGNNIADGNNTGRALIYVSETSNAPTDCAVIGNRIIGTGQSPYYTTLSVQSTSVRALVDGNYVSGGGNLRLNCNDSTVTNNVIDGAKLEGFNLASASRLVITNNVARRCGASGSTTTATGFTLDGLTDPQIANNIAIDSTSVMAYGFYINASTGIDWRNNIARGFTSKAYYSTNSPAFSSPPTLTATAGTVTIDSFVGSVVNLTSSGAVTVTNITAEGMAGRVITFVCKNASVTLTDSTTSGGNNLYLNGDFGSTTDATLTLACDGSKWYEISRSANYTA